MMEVVVTTGATIRADASIKSSPPTNEHPTFLQAGVDAFPVAQSTE